MFIKYNFSSFSGGVCLIVSGLFPVDILGETTSISALITYIFVHVEVIIVSSRFLFLDFFHFKNLFKMRRTKRHKNIERKFRVPCGSWLLPTVGSLLCILLLKGVNKMTVYRFLIWTGIGQIFYFSYGFWHSKKRKAQADLLHNSTLGLVATVEDVAMEYVHMEPDPDSTSEAAESVIENDMIQYF